MPEALAEFAYEDTPLPIEEGQTISQPYIVALMIAAIQPRPEDRVLEIGTGSGYAAAVLSRVVGQVYTVERHEALVDLARAPPRGRWDTATSRCSTATAASAGRNMRRTTRSS